jgi:hypothetical protein
LSVSAAPHGGALFEIELRNAEAADATNTPEPRGAAISS